MGQSSSTSAKPPPSRHHHHHHSSSGSTSGSKEKKAKTKEQTTGSTPHPPTPPPPPPRPGAKCAVCTTPLTTPPLPPTRQLACGHFYCRDCLRQLVAAQLDAGNPAPECCHDEPVSHRDVRWADRGGPLLARLKALRDDDGAARQLAWRQAQQNEAAPANNDTASAAALRERNARDGTDNLDVIYREAAAGAVTICFFCGAAIERAARPGCDDVVCVCGNRIKYSSGDEGGSTASWFARHGGPEPAVQKFAPQWILAEAEIARKRERKAKSRELAARYAVPGQPTPSAVPAAAPGSTRAMTDSAAVDSVPDFAYHFSGLRPDSSNPTPPRPD
ncbi:hypothetical protein DL766_000622 [Monosporascus sp. MC13-8B]|uniref:RING-type domain-containing protein n=1 Tax=Monosporascus cannonballus TaxID=155416 RepID=A0ABY0H133_9PEZI|nr:hypothetical protein DL762_006775 [Monosporascus cannonballus]RYP38982.1 hypothetical protein DL766_000622 [Monosporascus sp. MC13-8B]